jgi:hypothetical protein
VEITAHESVAVASFELIIFHIVKKFSSMIIMAKS